MRKFKFGIPLVGAIAIAFGLSGCADESHWGNSSNEKGSIRLNLTADSDINTEKPRFRSEEDNRSGDLNSYIRVPQPEEFSIRLEKNDDSYSKTWKSLNLFKQEAEETSFSTGAYTMTAYYGEKGTEDFNAPYFEASTTFNVLSDQVQEISMVAELMNSMIKINYTDDFKAYMADYHTKVRSNGNSKEIIYDKEKEEPLFIEPIEASLTACFTPKGSSEEKKYQIGVFAPQAKTIHNITFDVKENDNGDAQLGVTFDDTLDEETIYVSLSEIMTAPEAPTIECVGFTNGEQIDMLESSSCDRNLKMKVTAQAAIKSAKLVVESNSFFPSWGNEIDLCTITDDNIIREIENAGIKPIGFGFHGSTNEFAILDITDFGKSLPVGKHKVSLEVIDEFDSTSGITSVSLDSQPIELNISGEPSIIFGSKKAQISLDYNGFNADSELSFKAYNIMGNLYSLDVEAVEEVKDTRSFESKTYIFTLSIPDQIKTTGETLPVNIYHGQANEAKITKYPIPIIIPEYELEYDAFCKYAYIRIASSSVPDENIRKALSDNVTIQIDAEGCEITKDSETGIITANNLQANKTYNVSSYIRADKVIQHTAKLITEIEESIKNGDFAETTKTIDRQNVEVGGKYSYSVAYQATANIVVNEPNGWASINAKTCWFDCPGAKNTWFQVPSTYEEEGKVILRNVAYDHNGTKPAGMPTGLGKTYWYNTNVPDFTTFAAGELFLGTYTFDGTEHRNDGTAFSSRPSSIEFDYSYEPVGNDKASVVVKIKNSAGNVIASSEEILTGNKNQYTVILPRYPFGEKASILEICFRSSTSDNPKDFVHIPHGDELSEGFGALNFGNKNLGDNNYHAVAIGSKLTIDNVKAVYGDASSSANAPKIKTNKRK